MKTRTIGTILTCTAALLAGAAGLSGCTTYHPGGSGYSNDVYTYYSESHMPLTISLIDTRTGQAMWTYEIPVDRQLTVRFYEDESPSTPSTPAKMMWREFAIGTTSGALDNEMLVPKAANRRLDQFVRQHPEYPRTPAKAEAGR